MSRQIGRRNLFKVAGLIRLDPSKREVLPEKQRFGLIVGQLACQIFFTQVQEAFNALKQIFPVDVEVAEFHIQWPSVRSLRYASV